jgi:hypothetical protein
MTHATIRPDVRDTSSRTNCNPIDRDAPVTRKTASGSALRADAAGEVRREEMSTES